MFLVAAILTILSLPGFVHGQTPGTEKWHFATGNWVSSSPAIGADGTIYVGSMDSALYAINPDGTRKWRFAIGWATASSPAIGADGTIYVGSRYYNYFYAVNPDGTERWHFVIKGSVHSTAAIGADGTIYVGSRDNNLYAINPDGTEKWRFATGSAVWSSPAIGIDGTIYVGSYDNNLYAINPDGTEKWRFAIARGTSSSAAIGTDGTIYVGSYDNNLYAINPDGTEKWRFATGSSLVSSPAIGADGTIYVGSMDNSLYAINPDGTEKWRFTTGWYVHYSSPAIGADGTIYVGSYDNNLYAINSTSPGLAHTPWPMFHHDLKHTGRIEEPMPGIKANGSDGPVFVTPGGNVNITASLDPRDMAGQNCDWWVGALTRFGTYWVNPSLSWIRSDTPISVGQYVLFNLSERSLLNRPLPVGIYTFFFALDGTPDGVFDLTWYDYVNVICQPEAVWTEALPDFEALFQEKMKELMRE